LHWMRVMTQAILLFLNCMQWNCRMILNCKGFGRKRSWLLSRHFTVCSLFYENSVIFIVFTFHKFVSHFDNKSWRDFVIWSLAVVNEVGYNVCELNVSFSSSITSLKIFVRRLSGIDVSRSTTGA
jgi:hypothetical protein